ncbi:MAG: glycosyltransferase family 4 protein [Anaerolineales bacterium]|nr:glycosyltransferase family 4 protein [Anaerolineales bacterium]
MRLLIVADGRSPTAQNWISYLEEKGHEVHLASTFPCIPDKYLASVHFVPVAFSSARRGGTGGGAKKGFWGASSVRLRTMVRQWLGPFTLPKAALRLKEIIGRVEPEVVHAMRIPFEGMLAALADPAVPLLVSVWGNDFTLHGPSTPWMRHYTRQTLQRSDALHTDCQRDARLALNWGFAAEKPVAVLPGAGGVRLDIFGPGMPREDIEGIGPDTKWMPLVINPRGIRSYVRNDTFFQAIPFVLEKMPRVRFICPAMAGEDYAVRWLKKLEITQYVRLMPQQPRSRMADLFRLAQTAVSPSVHDGTPNTLLEAMACGCFPIAGDLESVREWITPGVNGLLVNPSSPKSLAEAILKALSNPELRQQARERNLQLVAERADYQKVMAEAQQFYWKLIEGSGLTEGHAGEPA